ncbi:ABC transporter permease [Haematobacter missouriensis]|uniref:ABC transporter permease n=1 Tax=Haematobacter missouriensis TaxID=366616 RepID=UPI001E63C71C|nr:ABC transporter permease [Haematobacter missouriensis]
MLPVIGRRLLQSLVTICAVVTLVFLLFSVIPGSFTSALLGDKTDVDPRVLERIETQLGLNQPVHERFVGYVAGLVRGDLGTSFATQRPVTDVLAGRIGASLSLAVAAILFAVAVGLPLGFIAAVRQGTWVDTLAMTFAVSGLSVPASGSGCWRCISSRSSSVCCRLSVTATGRSETSSCLP